MSCLFVSPASLAAAAGDEEEAEEAVFALARATACNTLFPSEPSPERPLTGEAGREEEGRDT